MLERDNCDNGLDSQATSIKMPKVQVQLPRKRESDIWKVSMRFDEVKEKERRGDKEKG